MLTSTVRVESAHIRYDAELIKPYVTANILESDDWEYRVYPFKSSGHLVVFVEDISEISKKHDPQMMLNCFFRAAIFVRYLNKTNMICSVWLTIRMIILITTVLFY